MVRTQACNLTGEGTFRPDERFNLCARNAATNTGICTTDVGGPLISLDGLIGIASWHRTPCGANQVITKKFNKNYVILILLCRTCT